VESEIMEAITVHPKSKEQLTTIAAILKALKIPFKKIKSEEEYDTDFVKEILQAKEDIKNGKGIAIKTEDLWK
jgi:sialic acid synthase SpsE